jgi:heat shock protein HslJ
MHSRLSIRKQFFLVLILFIGLLSCSTKQQTQITDITKEDTASVSQSASIIKEKYWKLIELYGQKVTVSESRKKEAYFILKEKNNSVIGHGGCNSFVGVYELSGVNRIKFSNIASTMAACIDTSVMETEVQFFRALESVDSYYVNGSELQLIRARMAPLAKFEAVYLK